MAVPKKRRSKKKSKRIFWKKKALKTVVQLKNRLTKNF
uniref:Ribosomal protein L32 n=1 Tax=Boodleopsis pusilla TaxID=381415 RepID=A0A386AZL2_9CHLO|nr:ribosomal protein L32 [Boodleopsis pusilla]AYC64887.1 ribosomal protein L32 [Boodleopsis pusilla]